MNKRLSLMSIILLAVLFYGCTAGLNINGNFVRRIWVPLEGNEFRVNGPEVATGPFKDRPEAKCTGLLSIDSPAGWIPDCWIEMLNDNLDYFGHGLYLELWGGHPGIENKRFTANGMGEYLLPEVGAANENCTYSYPFIPIDSTDLIDGANQFQFTCDTGSAFWSHYLLRQAALQTSVDESALLVRERGLGGFEADVIVGETVDEVVTFKLKVKSRFAPKIDYVAFQCFYDGFDENGDTVTQDWHGFTKDRKPMCYAAKTKPGELSAKWDMKMLPDQAHSLKVRAFVYFTDGDKDDELFYITLPKLFSPPVRTDSTVVLCSVADMPAPFWSRAGRVKEAIMEVPDIEGEITDVRLDVLIWDGGTGTVEEAFTINDHPVKIDDGGKHEVVYTGIRLDPGVIHRGANKVRLLSDTKHHGLECLMPGPAVTVRFQR